MTSNDAKLNLDELKKDQNSFEILPEEAKVNCKKIHLLIDIFITAFNVLTRQMILSINLALFETTLWLDYSLMYNISHQTAIFLVKF